MEVVRAELTAMCGGTLPLAVVVALEHDVEVALRVAWETSTCGDSLSSFVYLAMEPWHGRLAWGCNHTPGPWKNCATCAARVRRAVRAPTLWDLAFLVADRIDSWG